MIEQRGESGARARALHTIFYIMVSSVGVKSSAPEAANDPSPPDVDGGDWLGTAGMASCRSGRPALSRVSFN